jgi:hypothetical protein
MSQEMATEGTKHVIDSISVLTVVGTLADILPPIAALVTIVWTGIRIYETETVQSFIKKNKDAS